MIIPWAIRFPGQVKIVVSGELPKQERAESKPTGLPSPKKIGIKEYRRQYNILKFYSKGLTTAGTPKMRRSTGIKYINKRQYQAEYRVKFLGQTKKPFSPPCSRTTDSRRLRTGSAAGD